MLRISLLLACLFLATFARATSFDWPVVNFKRGHPTPGESLESAVAEGTSEFRVIERLDETIQLFKKFEPLIEITGHTDKSECSGAQCNELALLRATLVRDYLISKGICPILLDGPHEYGSERPLVIDEDGDEANQRTEMNMIRCCGIEMLKESK